MLGLDHSFQVQFELITSTNSKTMLLNKTLFKIVTLHSGIQYLNLNKKYFKLAIVNRLKSMLFNLFILTLLCCNAF